MPKGIFDVNKLNKFVLVRTGDLRCLEEIVQVQMDKDQ